MQENFKKLKGVVIPLKKKLEEQQADLKDHEEPQPYLAMWLLVHDYIPLPTPTPNF